MILESAFPDTQHDIHYRLYNELKEESVGQSQRQCQKDDREDTGDSENQTTKG
jgi:hypothetical protein